jgi:dephospho-CoA kinase
MAHSLYEMGSECYKTIVDFFGNYVLDKDGTIDRQKLGDIVFGDNNKSNLDALNSIVHPFLSLKLEQTIHQFVDSYKKEYLDKINKKVDMYKNKVFQVEHRPIFLRQIPGLTKKVCLEDEPSAKSCMILIETV